MGMLVGGQWTTQWYKPDTEGRFVRPMTTFRDRVTDGGPHPPAAGRYHLYVSYACPWAHRTLILRALKGLEAAIDVSVVHPFMGDDGWTFAAGDRVIPDPGGAAFLREVYLRAQADFTGRVTVPVLWDKQRATIVNNESREIIRMFDHAFAGVATRDVDFCPPHLADAVDAMITANYEPINNGVYRAGFARSQGAYDEAVGQLFAALERCEALLSRQRYLVGEQITEADWCLFTTLLRFDPVYVTHFKCNLRRIADYPQLSNYLRDLYQQPGVAPTCQMDHIRAHYYRSHPSINPARVVLVGFTFALDAPHDRGRF